MRLKEFQFDQQKDIKLSEPPPPPPKHPRRGGGGEPDSGIFYWVKDSTWIACPRKDGNLEIFSGQIPFVWPEKFGFTGEYLASQVEALGSRYKVAAEKYREWLKIERHEHPYPRWNPLPNAIGIDELIMFKHDWVLVYYHAPQLVTMVSADMAGAAKGLEYVAEKGSIMQIDTLRFILRDRPRDSKEYDFHTRDYTGLGFGAAYKAASQWLATGIVPRKKRKLPKSMMY